METSPHEFRKRVHHYELERDAHFLTFSCYQQLPLLSKDRTRLWLIQSISKARVEHAFDLWAWAIMPEHAHILIWPRNEVSDISKVLQSIKQPVATQAIDYLRRHNKQFLKKLAVSSRHRSKHRFWQAGPGHDRNLYEPKSIHEAIEYIHLNPVRRELVTRPEEWIWSSAREISGLEPLYLPVDRTVPPLCL